MSPRSFALFLDRIMYTIENIETSGVSVHGNRVNNLRFADDIDIIEQSNEKLQDTVDKLHTESERYGYKCSKDKDHGLWKKSQTRMMLK